MCVNTIMPNIRNRVKRYLLLSARPQPSQLPVRGTNIADIEDNMDIHEQARAVQAKGSAPVSGIFGFTVAAKWTLHNWPAWKSPIIAVLP